MSDLLRLGLLGDCARCPLKPEHPVLGSGPTPADLVIVGEAPGWEEVRTGLPFIGPSGRLLDGVLEGVGLDRSRCRITNASLCQFSGTSPDRVKYAAATACRERLLREIRGSGARLVVTAGAVATRTLLRQATSLGDLAGGMYRLPDTDDAALRDIWVSPTYHPSAVLRGGYKFFQNIVDVFARARRLLSDEQPWPGADYSRDDYYITTRSEADRVLDKVAVDGGTWSIDLETTSLRFLEGFIRQLGLSNGLQSYAIEWDAVDVGRLAHLFRLPGVQWVFHNCAFDLQWLKAFVGSVPAEDQIHDTMVLALGTTEIGAYVGLEYLSQIYLSAEDYKHVIAQYGRGGEGYKNAPGDVLGKYLCKDVRYTWQLFHKLTEEVSREGSGALCRELLLPAQCLFARMESVGVLIDLGHVETLRREWRPKLAEVTRELQDFALAQGFDARKCVKKPKSQLLNPSSWPQMHYLAFDLMGLKPPGGERTTGKPFLEKYEETVLGQLLVKYNTWTHMLSAYVDGIADDVWCDGRVHPRTLIFGTVTGRQSMQDPPLQTIPKEDRLSAEFGSLRKMFVAPPGHQLLVADYSQLEVRVAWHLSGDAALGSAVQSDDFHTETAMRAWRLPRAGVSDAIRTRAKIVTFSVMYGTSAKGLAARLKCPVHEAQRYIDAFFTAYREYANWYRETSRRALADQQLTTLFGRTRRWSVITNENRGEVIRQAVNFPVQSVASDINLTSAILVDRVLRERGLGEVCLVVHDSIISIVPDANVNEVAAIKRNIMTEARFPTCAKFDVKIEAGPNWSDLHALTIN